MNTKIVPLFAVTLLYLLPVSSFAQDLFCYRDDMGMLHCNKSMDSIPSQYRAKAFFKQDPINRNNAPSANRAQIANEIQPSSAIQTESVTTAGVPVTQIRAVEAVAQEPVSEKEVPQIDVPETEFKQVLPNNLPKAAEPKVAVLPAPEGASAPIIKSPKFEANMPSAVEPARVKSPVQSGPSQQPKIEIFVAKWCPHCRSLEDFLKLQKLKYTKYDVEEDPYGMEVFSNEGGGIPITKIGDSTIVGYDEKKFKAIVESKIPY